MQEEALRRTQEMQRRADAIRIASGSAPQTSRTNAGTSRAQPEPEPPPEVRPLPEPEQRSPENIRISENAPSEKEHRDHKSEPPAGEALSGRPSGGIFDVLFRDKEKTLILGLILLLMDEKTDNALLMALMYLLI